ncbi:ABC transporter ATP-binding protein [Natroniella sulfidigena]|uniref:ABC transporter ATP-binding protein n=1 Tax=Natroniella sulfidigena TaxID=723921 RepID=UPI00200B1059|nr:ABC transporter ATP-binding protein [Natroniella sulfidigena]MCK8816082.1 ABC transporter ATP-binding protein [Natroniella sulfidigena]
MLKVDLEKKFDNFEVKVKFIVENEILVLFGPSGSGKSTTLKLIAGLKEPDQGLVINQGVEFFNQSSKVNLPINQRNIGYVFQDYSLFPHMTVFKNIAFGIEGQGLDKSQIKKKVEDLLIKLRLEGLADKYPSQLSGGQQQRVAIARALIIEPELLLLDEPFSALDTLVREKLRQDLLRIHADFEIPVIYVTHNITDVFELADRVAVYNQGKIEQIGSKEDVFYRPQTRNVARFVEGKNIFDLEVDQISAEKARLKNDKFKLLIESKQDLKEGQQVITVIRPEFIEMIKDKSKLKEDNMFSGIIKKKLSKGAITRLFVSSFSQQKFDFIIDISTVFASELKKDSEILFKLPQNKIHLIFK